MTLDKNKLREQEQNSAGIFMSISREDFRTLLREHSAAEECVRELTQQRDLYKNHSDMYEETEAAICPDDLSFEAYIEALSKKVSVMETALRKISGNICGCLSSSGDNWHSETCFKSIAMKALSDQGGNNGCTNGA